MHLCTHTKPENIGQVGRRQSPCHDTMIDHDRNVGRVLDCLDQLGIVEDGFTGLGTNRDDATLTEVGRVGSAETVSPTLGHSCATGGRGRQCHQLSAPPEDPRGRESINARDLGGGSV